VDNTHFGTKRLTAAAVAAHTCTLVRGKPSTTTPLRYFALKTSSITAWTTSLQGVMQV